MLAAALFILSTSELNGYKRIQSVLPSLRTGDNFFGDNSDRRLQVASGGCAIENSNKQPGSACKCLVGFTGEIKWDGTKHSGQCIKDSGYVSYYYYGYDGNLQCTNPPTKPENGAVAFSNGNNNGSEATFTCDSGYYPSGTTKIECKIVDDKNTPWPAPDNAPACTPAFECINPPSKPKNGDLVFSDANQPGSVATFTCESGYELDYSVSITCEATNADTPWPVLDTIPECILQVICGNGVVQGAEQCECNPSHTSTNGNDCRYCNNCKLAPGKQCTPDGTGSEAATCCSENGMFVPANTTCNVDESTEGYCSGGSCVRASECDFEVDGQRLGKFCGVSDINPCALKCGSESTCYDTAIDYSPKLLKTGSVCMDGGRRGTCIGHLCLVPTQCGNGLLEKDEECECASGTECRFCSDCKLQDGKECTPDAATPCCDNEGMFLTTAASCVMPHGSTQGYCNRGVCASLDQKCTLDFLSGTGIVSLDQFCGVASDNPCKGKCGSSASSDICLEPEDLELGDDGDTNLVDGAICETADGKGECAWGTCVTTFCGDGVVEGTEECECKSGETECRHCSQCKLGSGNGGFRECTPDSADATAATCCDDEGMFATTSVQCTMPSGDKGYCNAGICSTFECRISLTLRTGENVRLDTFCGVSKLNSCSAMCESSATNTCYDPVDTWLEVESLADGAYCEGSDFRGICVSGECKSATDQTPFESVDSFDLIGGNETTTSTTFTDFELPPVPEELPSLISFSRVQDSEGANNKVKLLQFFLALAFVFYQVE